jgi:integrase
VRLKIKWVEGWAHVSGTGPDGKRVRRSLNTQDARIAEQKRAALETRLWRIEAFGVEAVITFAEAALSYLDAGGEDRYILTVSEKLGQLPLREITPELIRAAATEVYPKAAGATKNRQFITPARAVINHAHGRGWCSMIKVVGFKVKKPKRVAVDHDYLEALRPHLPLRAYALMLFLQQTGRRVSDAIELEPHNVQPDRVYIAETKNGEEAYAFLSKEMQGLIARLKPRHGRVFGYVGRSSLYPTLRRACAKAGVEYLGTHQVGRHSFATHLRQGGFTEKEVAEAGGWKTTRMVSEIYEHPVDIQEQATAHMAKRKKRKKRKAAKTAKPSASGFDQDILH